MMQGITIEQLRRLVDASQFSVYRGVMVIECEASQRRPSVLFDDSIRLDALTFWFCTKGTGRITCNLQTYEVSEGTLLLLPPKSIVTVADTSSCDGCVLLLDRQYLYECNINVSKMTSSIMRIMQSPGVRLLPAEVGRLRAMIRILQESIGDTAPTEYRADIIRSLVEMITFLCFELFMRHLDEMQPLRKEGVSPRLSEYFHRFIHELSQHYLERQSVSFYADRLCISSRYLTTIVRRVSGLSVSEWMNRFIMMEAKYLLKYTEMSIQEIAYKLSFPNQSFFGKFFKQHAGMSPSLFRSQP